MTRALGGRIELARATDALRVERERFERVKRTGLAGEVVLAWDFLWRRSRSGRERICVTAAAIGSDQARSERSAHRYVADLVEAGLVDQRDRDLRRGVYTLELVDPLEVEACRRVKWDGQLDLFPEEEPQHEPQSQAPVQTLAMAPRAGRPPAPPSHRPAARLLVDGPAPEKIARGPVAAPPLAHPMAATMASLIDRVNALDDPERTRRRAESTSAAIHRVCPSLYSEYVAAIAWHVARGQLPETKFEGLLAEVASGHTRRGEPIRDRRTYLYAAARTMFAEHGLESEWPQKRRSRDRRGL